jgi:hypothetical protein
LHNAANNLCNPLHYVNVKSEKVFTFFGAAAVESKEVKLDAAGVGGTLWRFQAIDCGVGEGRGDGAAGGECG